MTRSNAIAMAVGISAICGVAAAMLKVGGDRADKRRIEDLMIQRQALSTSAQTLAFVQRYPDATFGRTPGLDGSYTFAFMADVQRGRLYCEIVIARNANGKSHVLEHPSFYLVTERPGGHSMSFERTSLTFAEAMREAK